MKEIVEIFKNIDVLNLKIDDLYVKDDYEFCMNVFRDWCKYVDYPFNETSFYYFLTEFDNLIIEDNRIRFCVDKHDKYNLDWHLLNFKTKQWYDLGLIKHIRIANYAELFIIEDIKSKYF